MKTIITSLFVRIYLAVCLLTSLCAELTANAAGAPDQIVADPRTRQYIVPSKVVWISSGDTVKNAEVLLQKRSGQATLDASNPCVLNNKGGTAGVLLDFGRELHGGVQIMVWNTKDNKRVRLRVRFGESVSEAMSDVGQKNAGNDHAIRDQTCLVPWLGTHEIGNTGFRFVRIDLADDDSMIQLKSVLAVFLFRDLEYKGSFKCNDERLNRIWQTGAYTVHLNMQDYLWDGIKRDRLVWVGDMHPEAMTIYSVFGCNEIMPASLDLVRDETPLPNWMNGISSYSIWWILIQNSWYMQSGDLEYLKKQQKYLTGLLEQLIRHIDQGNRETLTGFRHSLCHGWASGPTAWLSEHVLGIKVLKPGCKVVRIVPHLGDLEWAEGTYPTPYGVITVRHVKKPDGTIDTKIDAPKEVQIVRK